MRLALLLLAAFASAPAPSPSLEAQIERAADLEGVPRPLLIAMAWVDSRLSMNTPSPDGGYGLLHLIDRPDAPPARSLPRAARLTGLSPEALRTDPFANALGGAALLRAEAEPLFAQYPDLDERRLGDWWEAVMRMSGASDAQVADSYAAQVYRLLRDGLSVQAGPELVRMAPQEFDVSARAIWGDLMIDSSGEYCPNGACVAFVPASASNYTAGRGGNPLTTVVIHDMEGSYASSISWFQNPSAQASAHYCIRSSDGEITQMVHDGDTAWHAGNWAVNQHAVGIEHEGFAHTGTQWYTEAMYRSSAALTRWLTDTYHIPKDRTHIIGHYEVPDPFNAGLYGGADHHHDPCDTWANGGATWHNVIACYWDWTHYMDLVNGTPGTGILTGFVGDACCGTSAGTRKPLPGATVLLEGTSFSATTDSSGTYSFTLPAGSYTPQASLGGYQPGDHSSLGAGYSKTIQVTAASTSWGSILLRPAQPVVTAPVVKIVSPADGAALSSAQVVVQGTVSDTSLGSVKVNGAAVAAANGAFSAALPLTPGQNAIVASATNAGGTGSATIHVSYAPPSTGVQGHVTSSGAPVANAGISATPGGAHTVSAADGSYALSLSPGAYTLAVDAAGFQPLSRAVGVPADKVATADLALQKSGAPAAAHIRIDSPTDQSTSDTDAVLVSGVAEVPNLKQIDVNAEQVDFDASGAFGVVVPLRLGPNELTVTAQEADGTLVTAAVHVDYQPTALGRTGCSSTGPSDLAPLCLLALGAMVRLGRRRAI